MKINNNNGHTISGLGSGAIGYLNESEETRNIGYYFTEGMRSLGHTVYDCTIDKSSSYLPQAVNRANQNKCDLAISHHLNCSENKSANGVEVWVYDMSHKDTVDKAKKICEEIAKLGFTNRGVKANPKFYWLAHTNDKAMIIEYL
ncbi:MAG: N-acetylmuramoyl-L-alanine amidase, partial [Romboutsia sp.]|nr:N-acetylmuramoyl-L-alanine amidase [Romboutsia sp.]